MVTQGFVHHSDHELFAWANCLVLYLKGWVTRKLESDFSIFGISLFIKFSVFRNFLNCPLFQSPQLSF